MTRFASSITRIALLSIVASAGLVSRAVAQATGAVEGTVRVTGDQPLADATVMLVGTTRGGRSDAAGKFRIPGLAPGSYQVRAQRIGYTSATQTVSVTAGGTATANFVLREAALSLDALVVTGTAGRIAQERSRQRHGGDRRESHRDGAGAQHAGHHHRRARPGVTVLSNSGQPGRGRHDPSARHEQHHAEQRRRSSTSTACASTATRARLTPNARQSTLAINDIKADDIERIEIVKGAAATTLYGTEAVGRRHSDLHEDRHGRPAKLGARSHGRRRTSWAMSGPSSDPTGLFLNECRGPDMHDAYGAAFVDPTCPSSNSWLQHGALARYVARAFAAAAMR